MEFKKHFVKTSELLWNDDAPPPPEVARGVEPWMTALVQAEHLNLLLGNGFTLAACAIAGASGTTMAPIEFKDDIGTAVKAAADALARAARRGSANVEDQIRAIRQLVDGLSVLEHGPSTPEANSRTAWAAGEKARWTKELDAVLSSLLASVLDTERALVSALQRNDEGATKARAALGSFVMAFGSRAAPRDRLHVFTTNYDRLFEYCADLLGVRIVDRFVGTISPMFRSSRLGVDYHYNPPGIRGEPRYLEGVVRLTKLHGSVDWRLLAPATESAVTRCGIPFGAAATHPELPTSPSDSLMIYPNAAKDVETLEYPYADLFRDFAAASCRPNSVLIAYGYSFGDSHVNRVLADMLSIPSTQLVAIARSDTGGRLTRFYLEGNRSNQMTVLLGPEISRLDSLVGTFLPKPAIDRTTWRVAELLARRGLRAPSTEPESESGAGA